MSFNKKIAQKKFILKTFKNELTNFLNFSEKTLPTFTELKALKNIIDIMLKFNASNIIKIWCQYIAVPYNDVIVKGDFNYFENKNYKNDLKDLGEENANYILTCYDKIRVELSNKSVDKKNKAMQYIQKISNLSIKYFT